MALFAAVSLTFGSVVPAGAEVLQEAEVQETATDAAQILEADTEAMVAENTEEADTEVTIEENTETTDDVTEDDTEDGEETTEGGFTEELVGSTEAPQKYIFREYADLSDTDSLLHKWVFDFYTGTWTHSDSENGIGEAMTGKQQIAPELIYFFDENGEVLSDGWVLEDGKYFYCVSGEEEELITEENFGSYYVWKELLRGAKAPTEKVQGLQEIEENTYFLEADGSIVKDDFRIVEGTKYVFDSEGKCVKSYLPVQEGWQEDENGWWYQNDEGNRAESGWLYVGDNTYYLDEDGYRLSGWQLIADSYYYFGKADDGAMKTGWQKLGKRWFYMDKQGVMQTGWKKLGNTYYYFGKADDGAMKTGWRKINNKYYYFGTENDGKMKYGWQKVGKKWYYLGSANDGSMKYGWLKLGQRWFYLGAANDGAMRTGFQTVAGKSYYFGGADDGRMRSGWQTIDGKKYYFGTANSGAMSIGWRTIDAKTYYFYADGKMAANCMIEGQYLDANGVKIEQNALLKSKLQAVISQVTTAGMSKEQKLRACYNYVVRSFTYKRKYDFNPNNWVNIYAMQMLTERQGNCYNFAATFGLLARELGYNAQIIAGRVTSARGGLTPHAWVEIGGLLYDTELQHANGLDLYAKRYSQTGLTYAK